MIPQQALLSLALALMLGLCLLAIGEATPYVDSDVEGFEIEAVAELVCRPVAAAAANKHLIGRASTISKLVDYLGELPDHHKLQDCRQRHLGPLAELVVAVEALSEDVCGPDKLLLLETYHRKYVSRVRKHLREQSWLGQAPQMAKLFFMQYVTEVSSTCEGAALKSIAANRHAFSASDLAQVEQLRKFTDALGMTDLSEGYRGIYLFWNMVDALDVARHDKFSDYLATGDEGDGARINVQMKNAVPIKAMREMCRHQLKPLYSKSLLPVLRLIDMGYYPHGTKLADEFGSDPQTKGLFFAAQICETLLHIEVYSDEQLGAEQFVALTKDETSQLAPVVVPNLNEIMASSPQQVEVGPSSLPIGELSFGKTPVDQVASNVSHRGAVINRLLRHLARNMKNKLWSVWKSGYELFSGGRNKQLQQLPKDAPSLEQVAPEQALHINEDLREEEMGGGEGLQARNKRDLHALFTLPVYALVYCICMVAIFSLKVALAIIPTVIALPFILAGNERVKDLVEDIWKDWVL